MRVRLAAAGLSFLLSSAAFASPPAGPSKMLTDPALSAERIAFVYGNDVWTCRLDGSGVTRITSGPGVKMRPAFSPDGSLLAFSAELDGNLDVYVVPSAGGVPKRLTWHPGRDVVQGFTPDGKSVLFTSPRAAVNNRHTQLYTVPVEGGLETALPIPYANRAAYSPDGKTIAYTPNAPAHLQWKRYRGGEVSRVWLYDVATHAIDRIGQPATRCNDADPMWLNGVPVARSDRDGEFNLYVLTQTGAVTNPADKMKALTLMPLTHYKDFPVLNAAAGAGRIVFEQAGTLHLYDASTNRTTDVAITVPGDFLETRPRWAKGAKWIRGAAISPSGARAAFEFRGEIVTVPAEKGDPRNLTNTTAAHERAPAWSPDGKDIAYVSDESGENEIVVRAQDGKGAPKKIKVPGAGFYDDLVFSPDGKKLVLTDNSLTLFIVDVASGSSKKIAAERLYAPVRQRMLRGSWSPDSRWVAYTLSGPTYIRTAFVYSVGEDKSFALTDGLSDVSDPAFDRGGKFLYFLASTDAGPQRNWFSLQNNDARVTNTIYVATLKKGTPSPLAKESDEEKGDAPKDAKTDDRKDDAKDGKDDAKDGKDARPAKKVDPVVIDFDGFDLRIIDLPVHPAEIDNLRAGSAGQIFFERTSDGKTSIQRFDFKDRKTETIVPEADDYYISFDGKKILFNQWESPEGVLPRRLSWSIVASSGKKADAKEAPGSKPSDGKLKLDAIAVRVDPRAEWPEIFDEAWRVNRDYFYDPKMHGHDWPAMKAKYAAFLPYLSSRSDLNRLIQWMCSELSVGHHRTTPGESFAEVTPVPGGLLGADYEVANGRYRFKKVFGGLNWNPELRAPLSEPGVEVKAGEYLLAVNGRDLAPPDNLYARFEGTSGKIVDITVGPSADGKGSRTVNVVPVPDEFALRNRDWVEGNLRKVDAATGGRVAYVYVPNTAGLGHTYFKRYFYPQASKDAIIVDERFNGGGSVADYYIEALLRQPIAWWTMRYGEDMKTPSASIQGPKVMIIDETAGSGGDLLPWMFRHFKVGTIVGQRTWGGLVGILGFPTLMDGAVVTAPNLGFWTPEEGFGVESVGVPPDVEVEQTPADVIAGHDPQLEKAIAIAMDELKKNPPVKPKRPPMPVR